MDIAGVRRALDRAAALLAQLSGGTVAKGAIDVYPHEYEPATIVLRPERANSIIGIKLEVSAIVDLARLDLAFTELPDGNLR